MKYPVLSIIFLFTTLILYAQETPEKELQLKMIAKYHEKSILIRWAPSETWLFEMGQTSGYKLERADFEGGNLNKNSFKSLGSNKGIILPYTRSAVETKLDTSNNNELIAAGILYGKQTDSLRRTPLRNANDPDEVATRSAALKNKRFFGLMAADYSFRAAEILGLAYRDTSVEAEKIYVYRISPVKTPKGIIPDTLYILATAYPSPIPERIKLSGESLESKVRVKWPKNDHTRSYSGFYLERSNDRKTFNKVNAYPYKPLTTNTEDEAISKKMDSLSVQDYRQFHSFADSIGVNYKKFHYRLVAIDPFGIQSIISDTIALFGRDLTPPDPIHSLKFADAPPGKPLKISWVNPNVNLKELKGLEIQVGLQSDGESEYVTLDAGKLISPSISEFSDQNPIQSGAVFYRVNAIDTAGNKALGIPSLYAISDTIPPLNPISFQAKVEESGRLTIWYPKSASQDAEKYMIYYAYGEKNEYAAFSSAGTRDTFYTDTVNTRTLNKSIFLKVITIDRAGNMSKPSIPLKVKIPDLIPPLTPTLQKSELQGKICYARFEKSFSNDVDHYMIQRKIDQRDWKTFQQLKANQVKSDFIEVFDTLKGKNIYHRLRLIAVDESGLESEPSEYAEFRDFAQDQAAACKNFKAAYDKNLKQVKLTWVHPEQAYMIYKIYKKYDNGKLYFVARTNGITDYTDRDLREKGTITYVLTAESKNKGQSAPVETTVNINP